MSEQNGVRGDEPFGPRIVPASDAGEMPPGFYQLRLALPAFGRVLDLPRPDMVAGRHSEADIHLPHPEISRRHCRFVFRDGGWDVVDLNSVNGVFVNEERTTTRRLEPFDMIRIGRFVLVVQPPAGTDADGTAILRFPPPMPVERRKAS